MADIGRYKEKMRGLKEMRAKAAELKAAKTAVELEVDKLESELKAMLEEDGETKLSTEDGTIYLSFIDQVSMPKDPEQKALFYDFLREKGLYEEMVSVNSQKLNGFYRKEAEAASERGDILFSMPGIEGVHKVVRVNFRQG